RVVVLAVRGVVTADAGTRVVGHVVDDGVHIDVDPHGFTALHHVRELGAGSRAAARDAVTDGLVAPAPGIVGGLDAVLLRRRDLHRLEPSGAEHVLALGGD